MKKDLSIQIIRVVSMLLIIICHLVQEYNNSILAMTGQILNVGVFIFFFLSGYLYSSKKIKRTGKWLCDRFIKLMIPIYIFMMALFVIQIIQDSFQSKYVLIYLLNVQKIFGGVNGAGHLWFMTVLMLCYFCTVMIKKTGEEVIKEHGNILLTVILGCSLILSYINREVGQVLFYINTYLFGFIYKYNEEKKNVKISYKFTCISSVLALLIRIISKVFIDGTVFYDVILVCLSQIIIAFDIFYIIKIICSKLEFVKNNILLSYIDNISFYIYITHYIFMVGPVRLMGLTNYMFINTLITLGMSYLTAAILKNISEFVIEKIKKEN